MKITATSSAAILQELAAWCQLAHDVLRPSQLPMERAAVRALKQHLRRHHARHLTQLRDWLRRRKASGRFTRQRPEAWAEVITAMSERNEYVAFAACALLERAVLAAYEKAADHVWLDNTAMRLIRRQRLVLKCCHSRHLRRPGSGRERIAQTRENHPVFGGLVAVAS